MNSNDILKRKNLKKLKKTVAKNRAKGIQKIQRNKKIQISCRCMGQSVHGIKIKSGMNENDLLILLKRKMKPKVKSFVTSLGSFQIVKPYVLLNNTSIEIAPSLNQYLNTGSA